MKRKWDNYKEKVAEKRRGKGATAAASSADGGITVQRLSSEVEGKCQKYTRIGPLTLVQLDPDKEPSLENIKLACQEHFSTSLECDVLAGERGPSFTKTSQIKNWKVIHIRFIENQLPHIKVAGPNIGNSRSEPVQESPTKVSTKNIKSTVIPRSVSISEMLKVGKLIAPESDVISLKVEEFSINDKKMRWLDPFDVKISVERKPFAEGAFREAYKVKPLSGLPKGTYVMKKYKEVEKEGISALFQSIEVHTRKSVQLNSLARNLAESMSNEIPIVKFGPSFSYNKVYFACTGTEFVTLEKFIDGTFTKWINNTGAICVEDSTELSLKAETFVHYTYIKSGKKLMVTDIQGVEFLLCDPEIATATQRDPEDESIYFCTGNLSTEAINAFFSIHSCNKFCKLLRLEEIVLVD